MTCNPTKPTPFPPGASRPGHGPSPTSRTVQVRRIGGTVTVKTRPNTSTLPLSRLRDLHQGVLLGPNAAEPEDTPCDPETGQRIFRAEEHSRGV